METHTQGDTVWRCGQRLECCIYKLRKVKDCWEPLEASTETWDGIPSESPEGTNPSYTQFCTVSLQICERINSCYLKPLKLCNLWRKPWETNTRGLQRREVSLQPHGRPTLLGTTGPSRLRGAAKRRVRAPSPTVVPLCLKLDRTLYPLDPKTLRHRGQCNDSTWTPVSVSKWRYLVPHWVFWDLGSKYLCLRITWSLVTQLSSCPHFGGRNSTVRKIFHYRDLCLLSKVPKNLKCRHSNAWHSSHRQCKNKWA